MFGSLGKELVYASKLTYGLRDFFKLLLSTLFFHAGNKINLFNNNSVWTLTLRLLNKKLYIEFRQNSGDIFTLYEIFGTQPYNFPADSLGKIRTIVDLGAHIGFSTLYFSSLFSDSKIYSVEASADNYQMLEKNINLNSINAIPLNKYISSENGTANIYIHKNSNKCSVYPDGDANISTDNVEKITMTDLINRYELESIDILKVDIEGAEGELFSDCKSWIDRVKLITIEVHPNLVDYDKLIKNITEKGFDYYKPGTFSPDYDVFLRKDISDNKQN